MEQVIVLKEHGDHGGGGAAQLPLPQPGLCRRGRRLHGPGVMPGLPEQLLPAKTAALQMLLLGQALICAGIEQMAPRPPAAERAPDN